MGIKQKILVGTLVASTTTVLVGSIIAFPPMIIAGGIGIGLSLRKRLLFKKKKQPKQKKSLRERLFKKKVNNQDHVIQKKSLRERLFKKKVKKQDHVIQLEPGQQLPQYEGFFRGPAPIEELQIMDY